MWLDNRISLHPFTSASDRVAEFIIGAGQVSFLLSGYSVAELFFQDHKYRAYFLVSR